MGQSMREFNQLYGAFGAARHTRDMRLNDTTKRNDATMIQLDARR